MWRVYTAILVALLGFFNFGVALVIVNTMIDKISEDLAFDKNVGGAVATSVFYISAMMSGLVAGPFEKAAGRFAQLWIGVFYALGNIFAGFTTDDKLCWGGPFEGCVTDMLFTGRVLTGFASGLMMVVSPKYLAAVSPSEKRGTIGAASQLAVSSGIFLGLLLGIPYEVKKDLQIGYEWWRFMFLLASLPCILQILLTVPTFPLFLQSHEEVRKSLSSKKSRQNIELQPRAQDNEVAAATQTSTNESPQESKETLPVTTNDRLPDKNFSVMTAWTAFKQQIALIVNPKYRHCVILGVGMPIVCRLCGIDVVVSYTTTIFENAGMDRAIIGSALFGATAFIGAVITVCFFDKFGRRTLAYVSFSGMAISHLGLSLFDLAKSSIAGPFSVVFTLAFNFAFRIACSTLCLSYAPEVVPTEIAGTVLGLGQSLSLVVSFVLVLVFPSVLNTIGALWAFFILFVFCFSSLLFMKVFMVETKGRELEDIKNELLGA